MATRSNAPPRVVMRIEMYPNAKQVFAALCNQLGVTQNTAAARVVEWFTDQPQLIQSAILGHYPSEIRADVAVLILTRITKNKKNSRKFTELCT
jgi:hypothetical protein